MGPRENKSHFSPRLTPFSFSLPWWPFRGLRGLFKNARQSINLATIAQLWTTQYPFRHLLYQFYFKANLCNGHSIIILCAEKGLFIWLNPPALEAAASSRVQRKFKIMPKPVSSSHTKAKVDEGQAQNQTFESLGSIESFNFLRQTAISLTSHTYATHTESRMLSSSQQATPNSAKLGRPSIFQEGPKKAPASYTIPAKMPISIAFQQANEYELLFTPFRERF